MNYRYPGAQPFRTEQRALFFGRKRDIEALSRLIRLEPLVVLYSKSGLGKSSLLQAGILPSMQAEGKYQSVSVRFQAYSEASEDNVTPLARTQAALRTALDLPPTFVQKILPKEDSLWYILKTAQAARPKQEVLLLFDQFEELFTYPAAEIEAFKRQLAEVLNTQIPQRFRLAVEQEVAAKQLLNSNQLALLHTPYQARVVFAIRSDRMSLLDRISDYLPIVKRAWYELDALNELQAEEAIYRPAYQAGTFITPIFDYEDNAVDAILDYLTKGHQQKIESFQLQILCQAMERKVEQQGIRSISRSDLGNIQTLYENYYDDQIQQITKATDQLKARRFIEEGLVFEEEERRLSLYEGQIHRQYGVDDALLTQLTATHLIRREPSMRGGYTYELSHDTLVPAILKAKGERRALEEEDRQVKALREERRKRRRANFIAAVGLALAIISIVASGLAWQQNRKTQKTLDELRREKIKVERAKQEADENEKLAYEKAVAAENAKLEAQDAKVLAQQERDKAKIAQINTERTLNELQAKNSTVVKLILKNAALDVLNLRYDAALAKIQDAASIGAEKDAVAKAMLEIAFWQNEIGNNERALGLLDSTATILNASRFVKPTTAIRTALREAMRSLLPTHFDYLFEEKYYPKMIAIEGGIFWMGCDTILNQRCYDNETWHKQDVEDFEMAKYETTVWQFALYCAATPKKDINTHLVSTWKDIGNNPVVRVSWFDAILYSNWLNKQMGLDTVYVLSNKREGNWSDYYDVEWKPNVKGFQLPTEAQWEYAAKGGVLRDTFIYSGSNMLDNVAWYGNNANRTEAIGKKLPNALGLHDLSGNVWEWCWDWYAAYPDVPPQNYRGPEEGSSRILRGGSWNYNDYNCRTSNRNFNYPDDRSSNDGFRLTRY